MSLTPFIVKLTEKMGMGTDDVIICVNIWFKYAIPMIEIKHVVR